MEILCTLCHWGNQGRELQLFVQSSIHCHATRHPCKTQQASSNKKSNPAKSPLLLQSAQHPMGAALQSFHSHTKHIQLYCQISHSAYSTASCLETQVLNSVCSFLNFSLTCNTYHKSLGLGKKYLSLSTPNSAVITQPHSLLLGAASRTLSLCCRLINHLYFAFRLLWIISLKNAGAWPQGI